MSRHHTLRDNVLNALLDVYSGEPQRDWYNVKYKQNYTTDLCMQLTTDILGLYVWAHVDEGHVANYYLESGMGREIQNMIWMVFPGGGTAEIAAKKVCEILGVDYEA